MNQQILATSRTSRRVNVVAPVGLLAPISDFNAWKLHMQNGAVASRVMDGNAVKTTIVSRFSSNNAVQIRNEQGTAINGQALRLKLMMWASENYNVQLTSDGPAPYYANLGLSASMMLTTTPTLFEFDFIVQNYEPGPDKQHFLPSFYIGNMSDGASVYQQDLELITR